MIRYVCASVGLPLVFLMLLCPDRDVSRDAADRRLAWHCFFLCEKKVWDHWHCHILKVTQADPASWPRGRRIKYIIIYFLIMHGVAEISLSSQDYHSVCNALARSGTYLSRSTFWTLLIVKSLLTTASRYLDINKKNNKKSLPTILSQTR